MKARVKTTLSKQAKQAVREYVDSYEKDCMRRFFKFPYITLNKKFGLGKSQLTRFIIDAVDKTSEYDEIFFRHVDQLLIDKMGIPFEREKEG